MGFRNGPTARPPPSQTPAIIFSSSSSTMASSSLSLRSSRNAARARLSGPPGPNTCVPLIGFITATPSSTDTCRSGLAPTNVLSPRCTRKVQYAPVSEVSRFRNSAAAFTSE